MPTIISSFNPSTFAKHQPKRIKEVSKAVLEKFGGDLSSVLALPKEEARKRLMELPGIGKNTANILPAYRHLYAEVMVVDTHMERIAKRLGLVSLKQNTKKFKRS